MFDGGIVPFLSLLTLLAVGVLALISKERAKERMRVVRRIERVPVAAVRRQMLGRDKP